jgi:high-affinity iron transporter
MLINTVILFLRDALPIFVLLVFLSAHLKANRRWISLSLLTGGILGVLYVTQIQLIATWFQGNGIELLRWLVQCIIYLLTLLLGYSLLNPKKVPQGWLFVIAAIMMGLTFAAKGGNFMLYFAGYWQQSNMLQSMLVGTLLGIGICASIAILLYLCALWLRQQYGPWLSWLLILVHTTGQLTNTLSLLVQIDLIDDSSAFWDSQNMVSNQSEIGYFLNVLLGYQATPSLVQLALYFSAVLLPIVIFYWLKQKHPAHSGKLL